MTRAEKISATMRAKNAAKRGYDYLDMVKSLKDSGFSYQQIAAQFGVTKQMIHKLSTKSSSWNQDDEPLIPSKMAKIEKKWALLNPDYR